MVSFYFHQDCRVFSSLRENIFRTFVVELATVCLAFSNFHFFSTQVCFFNNAIRSLLFLCSFFLVCKTFFKYSVIIFLDKYDDFCIKQEFLCGIYRNNLLQFKFMPNNDVRLTVQLSLKRVFLRT